MLQDSTREGVRWKWTQLQNQTSPESKVSGVYPWNATSHNTTSGSLQLSLKLQFTGNKLSPLSSTRLHSIFGGHPASQIWLNGDNFVKQFTPKIELQEWLVNVQVIMWPNNTCTSTNHRAINLHGPYRHQHMHAHNKERDYFLWTSSLHKVLHTE